MVCDRHQHADHTEAVALARRAGAGETAQREDEQHARNEIGEGSPGGRGGEFVHVGHQLLRSFFLYMASIRSVTAKPPKMFTLARATATSPKAVES